MLIIQLKYINMKCNLSNDIRAAYKSKFVVVNILLCHSRLNTDTFVIHFNRGQRQADGGSWCIERRY